jgi:acetylcholinesterase
MADLRFRLPVPIRPYIASDGKHVTSFGVSCPQQPIIKLPFVPGLDADSINYAQNLLLSGSPPEGEDCLTVNVIAPANATPDSKLPVVVVC